MLYHNSTFNRSFCIGFSWIISGPVDLLVIDSCFDRKGAIINNLPFFSLVFNDFLLFDQSIFLIWIPGNLVQQFFYHFLQLVSPNGWLEQDSKGIHEDLLSYPLISSTEEKICRIILLFTLGDLCLSLLL